MTFFRRPPRPGGLVPPRQPEPPSALEAGRRSAEARAEREARWARAAAEADAEFEPILDEKGRRRGVRRGGSGEPRYPVVTAPNGSRTLLVGSQTSPPPQRSSLGRLTPLSGAAPGFVETPQDPALVSHEPLAVQQIEATRSKTFHSVYDQWRQTATDPEGNQHL